MYNEITISIFTCTAKSKSAGSRKSSNVKCTRNKHTQKRQHFSNVKCDWNAIHVILETLDK